MGLQQQSNSFEHYRHRQHSDAAHLQALGPTRQCEKTQCLASADANPSNRCSHYFSRLPALHCQNDAELCLAAHHSLVSLGRFF